MWPDRATVVALAIVAGAVAAVAVYAFGWVEIIDRTREVRDRMPARRRLVSGHRKEDS